MTLFVSSAALNNDEVEKYKFLVNPDDTRSPTETKEPTLIGDTGEVYDYRSNNGIIFPLRYVSARPAEYQTFLEDKQKFQILPDLFDRSKNSSDSGDGVSVKNTEQQNANATEAIISSKDTPPTSLENFNSVGHVSGPNYLYSNSFGALFPVRYILAPQLGYHMYEEGIPQYRISSSIFQQDKKFVDPNTNKNISSGGKHLKVTNVSEAVIFSERTEDTGASEHANSELNNHRDNNGDFPPAHYILNPHVGYHPYGKVLPRIQILSNTVDLHQTSPDAKRNNDTSMGANKQKNTNVSEAANFSEGKRNEINAAEQANVKSDLYTYHNGDFSTTPYILNHHVGYQPYGEILPKIQILSDMNDQYQTSSDSELNNGTFLEGNKQENTISLEGKNSNNTKESSTTEQTNVKSDLYAYHNGAFSNIHYILNPYFENYPYEEVLPQTQILANTMEQHRTSLNIKSNNDTYAQDIKRRNTSSSEDTLESQQLTKSSNLIFESGNSSHFKLHKENGNNTDVNETKMLQTEVSNNTSTSPVSEDSTSVPSDSLNRKPEQNSQSYADFLTTSLKTYHNEFPLYWIANHPSIESNHQSSSYFVPNHLTYPLVPLYYHLVV